MESIEQEKVFHSDNNVTVTQSRFVSSGKTYAMRNISSVSTHHIAKSRALPIFLLLFGVVMLIAEAYIFGIIIGLLGVAWLFSIKDEFSVRIQSNSGEADGLISKDRGYVEKIVYSINEAIIYRG